MKHNGRTTAFWILASLSVPLLVLAVANLSTGSLLAQTGFTYQVFTYPSGTVTGSEIVDITPNGKFALSVGRNETRVGGPTGPKTYRLHVVNVSTDSGTKVGELNIGTSFPAAALGMTEPIASSVAVHPTGNYAIVTLRENSDAATAPGRAIFIAYDPNTGALAVAPGVNAVALGVNPESIAIDPTGTFAVVANEGNIGANDTPGPNGSIVAIDLRDPNVRGVVPVAGLSGVTNPNPEAVTISSKGQAFVSLQPNNAVAVVNVTAGPPLSAAATVQVFSTPQYPDGLTTTPDGSYLITANEGITGTRPASTSLWSITGSTLAKVGTDYVHFVSGTAGPRINPEMVDAGLMFGAIKAFVSLETGNAVEALTVTPAGLQFDQRINVNTIGATGQLRPEGVSVVDRYIAVAHSQTSNVSVIVASGPAATPPPSTPPAVVRTFLPLAQK